MSLHLQRDLDLLKKEILQLGSMVEKAIMNATVSLNQRRPELARKVFEGETLIDEREVQIEEFCLKILALHQPVATDLRFIVVALKVNNDLERMGDFAENVAERAVFLSSKKPLRRPLGLLDNMSRTIRTMVRQSLDSLVKLDVELAREVIDKDFEVDEINRLMYVQLQTLMENDHSTVQRGVSLLSTSRYLERIADLATNICEDVLFMVEGEVVRHKIKG